MKIAMRRALAMRVLCVAVRRVEGSWCAYIDAVDGMRHDQEQDAVAQYGSKLPEHVARAIFGDVFDGLPYAE